MKLSISYIRSMAKGLLRNNYGTCASVMAIYLLIAVGFALMQQAYLVSGTQGIKGIVVSLLLSVLALALLSPGNVGCREVLCDVAGARETKAGKMLRWYGDPAKLSRSILLMLLQSLLTLAALLLFGALIFCGAHWMGMDFVANLQSGNLLLQMQGLNQVYMLMLLTMIPVYLVLVPYLPAAYIMAEDPEKKALACMGEARRLIRGYYWKYVGMQMISFLQILAYSLWISFLCVILFRNNIMAATGTATLILQIIVCFKILPHLGIATSLFLNDIRVRNQMAPADNME